ncbi:hypothetical protein ACH4PU_32730 [Streptomyces sp. NPDC021100]|uniref:hypothetical protein n=1 Tax=Streptomyces sp. NPDC021100 TaxID=3365114 RepID=UPI0037966D30
MSRTWHHRRHLHTTEGNPARALGVDTNAAVRKGILVTGAREDGWPEYTRGAHPWGGPGARKAFQKASHRRERAGARQALRIGAKDLRRTGTKPLTVRAEALPPCAEPPRAEPRRVDWDMS